MPRTLDSLFEPGRNCATVARADRMAVLIDGDAYFRAFAAACELAERSIIIAGWDCDYFTRLYAGREHDALGPFLHDLVARRRDLRVYVLTWNYSSLYLRERGLWSKHRRFWHGRPRLSFHLDDAHPVSGTHHQKIVVIDGALAFSGGIDLCQARWDSSAHAPIDPRRVYEDGVAYGPFHDVQAMVSGRAAEALAGIVAQRWQRATGRAPRLGSPRRGLWPDGIGAELEDVDVAVARTVPALNGAPEHREVQALYEDAIAAAERTIYLENQFLTSEAIVRALEQSLHRDRGPEIVIVAPSPIGGWFENGTMGVLRARAVAHLRGEDRHGRLRVLTPVVDGTPVMLHSKVMIADDRFLRVGSANLSNRSMGLDSECDLAIVARRPREVDAVRTLRARFLAEHLGAPIDACRDPSLFAVLDRHQGGPRTLATLVDPEPAPGPTQPIYDTDKPAPIAQAADVLLRGDHVPSARRPVLVAGALLVTIAALILLWRFTPLSEWLQPEQIERSAAWLRDRPLAPLWLTGGFTLASLLLVPVTLLLVQAGVLLGAVQGLCVSIASVLASSAIGFGIGRLVSRPLLARMRGPRWQRLQRMFERSGPMPVAFVRLFPIAPFTVINVVAGASPCTFRSFMLGTCIGMLPGMVALTVFGKGIYDLIVRPTPGAIAVVVLVAAAAMASGMILRARLRALRS